MIVDSGVVVTVLSLLSHENNDIIIDALEVIQDLTDEDVGDEELIKVFSDALVCDLMGRGWILYVAGE